MLRIPSRLDARRREPTSTAARMYRAASTDAVGCRAAGPWPARPGIAPRTTATTDGRPKTATDLDLLDAHGRAGALDGCGGTTKADGAPFRVWLGRCRSSCSPTAPHPRTGLAVRGSVGPLVEPFPMPQPPVETELRRPFVGCTGSTVDREGRGGGSSCSSRRSGAPMGAAGAVRPKCTASAWPDRRWRKHLGVGAEIRGLRSPVACGRRRDRAPSHPPGARYSTRIATIGSTRSARRVGTTQASRHTPSMNAA